MDPNIPEPYAALISLWKIASISRVATAKVTWERIRGTRRDVEASRVRKGEGENGDSGRGLKRVLETSVDETGFSDSFILTLPVSLNLMVTASS